MANRVWTASTYASTLSDMIDNRHELRLRVKELAADQDGVVSRKQVYDLGGNRWTIAANVRAERWTALGRHALLIPGGTPTWRARARSAVLDVGSRAALDGVSALVWKGLVGFEESVIHVSAPKSANPRHPAGVRVHETRRRREGDVVEQGLTHTHMHVAAVRGALWAKSDRQAALIMIMAVQQGLTSAELVAEELSTIIRDPRRGLLLAVHADIAHGVRALGELDFARMCRDAGLPEPDRQCVMQGPRGRCYLDVRWTRWRVVVEVDGVQHLRVTGWLEEAQRHNDAAIRNGTVLRIPVLGLRIEPSRFMAQVAAALMAAGWVPEVPRRAV